MTTNDTSTRATITRATIARDGDDTYFLYVGTLPNASENISVTAYLTGGDVETIAGWANAPKVPPGMRPLVPTVRAGLIELTLYADNVVEVSASSRKSTVSWRLTETASRELIEEAGRWTR